MSTPNRRICPSSTVGNATTLLAVVGGDGRAHYVSPPIPLTDAFRREATAVGDPERRFRLAGPCVEGDCVQWSGERCTVADAVVDEDISLNERIPLEQAVSRCAIRRTCRWFAQRGLDACRVCPSVVTDSR